MASTLTSSARLRARGGRKPRRRDPAIGTRIRALRQARGLTQAQLAGDTYTKGFISLLETNRVALSLPAALNLAPRLGISVAELIGTSGAQESSQETDLALVRAESAFAAGKPDEALALGKAATKTRGVAHGRWLRLQGRILIQTEHSAKAAELLEEAIRIFRDAREKELVARTLYDLALAYGRLEAHGEAVHHALLCENAIYAGDVVDRSLELRVLSLLAGLFVTIGDHSSADLRIERAKKAAEDVTDKRAVGNLYANLAIAREREGDLESALHFAKKGLASYEELGLPAHVGNMWNTVGWVYIGRKQFLRAAQALDEAEGIARTTKDDHLLAYVLQSRAELALAQGQAAEALALARASAAHPGASSRGAALSLLVSARALARSGAPLREVHAAFQAAAEKLRPLGKALEASAHQAHFEALMERGRRAEAAEVAARAFALVPRGA